eukprot:TRINITY_DN38803_c0_g2_i1.p1 TRINITY_DN38803_c0_g2~~TRINITY_DN38803_c0_g2_i1.p1  ORF type:complete len:199 (+),score=25.39 TRINITY_DN38803_c0_g2_i1:198-794(+)
MSRIATDYEEMCSAPVESVNMLCAGCPVTEGPKVSPPPWSSNGDPATSKWDCEISGPVDDTAYTHTVLGDCPIIITAPHGGNLDYGLPHRVPIDTPTKRNVRRVCSETDHNTAQLACAVEAELRRLGVNATLVVGKLLRSVVDLNRPESLCAETHEGFVAWHEYHSAISSGIHRALSKSPHAHVFLSLIHISEPTRPY